MSPNAIKALESVLYSGYIGQGKKVDLFEKKLARFIGNPFVLTVNSGTSALHLALRLANVHPGDEVISTPMTCTATNWPILACGAKIVWADIDPSNGNISSKSIQECLSKKTKAIVVVDWGGYPVDIDSIRKAAGKIPIIEDAAHAFGAVYKNKMIGNNADFTCFSFQAIKHLTTGDGGALICKKIQDYQRGKLLRWYGIDRKKKSQDNRIELDVREWGYKFHMNDLNATIGIENLKFVKGILHKNRENANYYKRTFQGLKYITLLKENPDYLSSYWLFTLRVKNRPQFIEYLKKNNVIVSRVHRRNDTHPVVAQFKKRLPGVDIFDKEMTCIPVGWWLNMEEKTHIAKAIISFSEKTK